MKAAWLNRAGHPRALVFFAGWGMDDAPFRRLGPGNRDVLAFWDYRCMDEVPLAAQLSSYRELSLVAWSLGCAAGNCVAQQLRWELTRAVAISGTLLPEDEEAGIPTRWMEATARHVANGGWEKFVRRMCPDEPSIAAFNAAPPSRRLDEAVEELQVLRRLPAPASCVFRAAAVCAADRIILPENQRRCWSRYGVPAREIAAPHYPFHLWHSWEEVLSCTG